MKILIIRTFPEELNIEKVTYNYQEIGLAKALIKAGNQCDILCSANNEPTIKEIEAENNKRIKLYCVKATKIFKNAIFHNIDDILKEYDILQLEEYNQIYSWHIAKKYNKKMIIYHGPYYNKFNKRYNLMCKFFDLFLKRRYIKLNTPFITKSALATEFLNKKGIKNVTTIGVGIDLEALERKEDEKKKTLFENKIENFKVDYKLLYIGRIEPRRNCLFLLDILKNIRDKGINVGLVIIGKGIKGYDNVFFEYAKKLKLNNYILYEEAIGQKYLSNIYKKTDLFLLPTIYDIFGMVILEAMYYKMPIITSINGGSTMLIKTKKNGIIIDKFETDKWVDSCIQILENKKEATEMGILANKEIVENFTWDALSEKFVNSYRNVIDIEK